MEEKGQFQQAHSVRLERSLSRAKPGVGKIKQVLIVSLISVSAVAWVISITQPGVMAAAMVSYDPALISLFAVSWTVGMAAMMFPAISPMVLLYNKLTNGDGSNNVQALVQQGEKLSLHSSRTILFVGSYLLIWALTGIALLLVWSLIMDGTVMNIAKGGQQQSAIYGAILIISGF